MPHRKKGFITATLAVTFALMLGACDNDDKKPESANEAPPQDTSITLSADGVGPINSTTSFNMHQMTVAFANYNVIEEVKYIDGNSLLSIRISEGVNTVLNVIPDASRQGIYSVIIEDNIVKNTLGHPLGTAYNAIYPYGQNEKCQAGVEDFAKKVLCYAPQHPNILYVFNGSADNAVEGKMPSADILQGWGLESIIWRPKS